MRFLPPSLVILALFSGSVLSKKVGDICGTDSDKGVCEPTSWCKGRSGTVSQAGLCPGTPSDVRCCYYPKCSSPYQSGYCKPTWEVDGVGVACWGTFKSGHCPGPNDYKCCYPGA
ncbi:hypothetical protein V8F33_010574 [Rhypophila sp. PSN 637]